mgnify:CR=1 FL=1
MKVLANELLRAIGLLHGILLQVATSTRSPILPVYVAGRNSLFFYSLSALDKPLSTLWLVREMFKQSHKTVDARIGRPVPHEVYNANGFSARQLAAEFKSCDVEEDFKLLEEALAARGLPVPTLYRHYSQATSPDGVCFTAFNVDEDFGECVDSFVMADLHKLTARKKQRYLES